ncbi:hypothetical protein [Desulfoluna limicola]|nr:hypothetical protein [Desulfoluna limicola]
MPDKRYLNCFVLRVKALSKERIVVTIPLVPPAALPGAKLLKSLTNRF